MRFTAAAAAVGMAGVATASWSPDMGAHGHGGSWGAESAPAAAPASNATVPVDVYTTEVVTAFTTFCPKATEVTHAGETYTVSEATTLVITNCPDGCTVTKPVSSAVIPATSVPATSAVETTAVPVTSSAVETAPVATTPVASSAPVVAPVPYPSANGTTVAPVGSAPAGSASGAPTVSSATGSAALPEQTGNTASSYSAGIAGILAVFGLVAAL